MNSKEDESRVDVMTEAKKHIYIYFRIFQIISKHFTLSLNKCYIYSLLFDI